MPPNLGQGVIVLLEQLRSPGHPSSSLRAHAQAIRRSPSSIPLVQWTPDKKGFLAHHERKCSGRSLGVAFVPRKGKGGRQDGDVLHAGKFPQLL